ncbi:MAG: signal peptide peptidase SppA [Deltaproteobacteria bacterium]|nr:signal peptide peptidase SppA [Deltaproteobacteria bacterium]
MKDHPFLWFLSFFGIFFLVLCAIVVFFIFSVVGEKPEILKTDTIGILKVEGLIYEVEPLLKVIQKYQKQSSIKAVVVRIESPGGAVGPSQELYQALKELGKTKKVVASLGAVAASGGYYTACGAHKIIANPGTLTGSIGVIMEFAHLQDLFQWAKISHTVIKSGRYKDVGSPFRPMKEDERKLLEELIGNVYQQFKGVVLAERKIRPDQVEMVTDGRIFTGAQAKELGLVDDLGSFEFAVEVAKQLADLKGDIPLLWPSKEHKYLEFILGETGSSWFGQTLKKQMISTPLFYLMPI